MSEEGSSQDLIDDGISNTNNGYCNKTRSNVLGFVENRYVQTFLTLLLFFDVVTVIAGVAIDAEYPACSAALKVCGLKPTHECEPVPHSIYKASETLQLVSNSILFVFVGEIFLTMFGVGIITYVTTFTYLFDAIVVIASLAVELLEGKQHHDTGLLVSLGSFS
jgi:hypothetical protein